ncbi:MAG: hypothetical protein AB2693_26645 [Candidatus Thiodiazotropha sp.]
MTDPESFPLPSAAIHFGGLITLELTEEISITRLDIEMVLQGNYRSPEKPSESC